jgi:hypothetical protein
LESPTLFLPQRTDATCRPRPWEFGACRGGVQVIGDALVPRKVAHALAEGRAAAASVVDRLGTGA